MTGCGHKQDAGAYVLGALSPEDRVDFERHLPGCPECARSVRELAGLPGLLARVPVAILDPEELPAPVPETLLPAVVRRAEKSRRRRRLMTGGLVAAALAGAVAIGAGGVAALTDDTAPVATALPTAAARPLAPVGAGPGPISGWVSLTQVGWGTRLDLTCSYVEEQDGYQQQHPGATYSMYVTRDDGSTERVASWRALPGKTMHLTAATASDADDIARVEVRTSAGETVLESG